MKVNKAIFPVAGLGTRFLPATKAQPKEMLPVVDKPLIQYAVEEAYAAGVREMIFVTGRHKRPIEDHFDMTYELEVALDQGLAGAIRQSRDKLASQLDQAAASVRNSGIAEAPAVEVGGLDAGGFAHVDEFAAVVAEDVVGQGPADARVAVGVGTGRLVAAGARVVGVPLQIMADVEVEVAIAIEVSPGG